MYLGEKKLDKKILWVVMSAKRMGRNTNLAHFTFGITVHCNSYSTNITSAKI